MDAVGLVLAAAVEVKCSMGVPSLHPSELVRQGYTYEKTVGLNIASASQQVLLDVFSKDERSFGCVNEVCCEEDANGNIGHQFRLGQIFAEIG